MTGLSSALDSLRNALQTGTLKAAKIKGTAHVQRGVQYLLDPGRMEGKALVGSNGNASTDSLATYREWLQAHAGFDAYA